MHVISFKRDVKPGLFSKKTVFRHKSSERKLKKEPPKRKFNVRKMTMLAIICAAIIIPLLARGVRAFVETATLTTLTAGQSITSITSSLSAVSSTSSGTLGSTGVAVKGSLDAAAVASTAGFVGSLLFWVIIAVIIIILVLLLLYMLGVINCDSCSSCAGGGAKENVQQTSGSSSNTQPIQDGVATTVNPS